MPVVFCGCVGKDFTSDETDPQTWGGSPLVRRGMLVLKTRRDSCLGLHEEGTGTSAPCPDTGGLGSRLAPGAVDRPLCEQVGVWRGRREWGTEAALVRNPVSEAHPPAGFPLTNPGPVSILLHTGHTQQSMKLQGQAPAAQILTDGTRPPCPGTAHARAEEGGVSASPSSPGLKLHTQDPTSSCGFSLPDQHSGGRASKRKP